MTKSEDTAQVTLWTMNYFFVSGNKKRIILFACVQTMRSPQGGDDLEEEGDEYQGVPLKVRDELLPTLGATKSPPAS